MESEMRFEEIMFLAANPWVASIAAGYILAFGVLVFTAVVDKEGRIPTLISL